VDDLTIDVSQEAFVKVRLQVGEVRTFVTVMVAAATELSAQSNAIGTIGDSVVVRELPSNGRNFLQLGLLSGGTNEVSVASDIFASNVGPPGRLVVLPGTGSTIPRDPAYSVFSGYWRLTRSLTLNYGVSWFLETPPDAQGWARDLVHSFNPDTGLVTYAGLKQTSPKTMVKDKNNFGPSLGVAWNPGFSRSTVIRVGAGMYYSEFPWLFAPYPVISPSPRGVGQSFANGLTNPFATYTLGTNVFPRSVTTAVTSSYPSSLLPGTTITLLNRDFCGRTVMAGSRSRTLQPFAD